MSRTILNSPDRVTRRVDRAAVISDLHLTPTDLESISKFEAFTRKLPGRIDELLILGDLFEAYVGTKHLSVPGYRPVVRALDMLVSNGIAVTCLWGNRDFLLDSGFTKATGVRVAGDEDSFLSGGSRVLVCHGDLFCSLDVHYQAMRKKLRSRWIQRASRFLPLPVALGIARRLRNRSTQEISQKSPSEMGIVAGEVERRVREGFDLVICGHVHDPSQSRRILNADLIVLPAWPAAPGTLWLDRGSVRHGE